MNSEIRRGELCNTIQGIYSELSVDTPSAKRQEKARAVLKLCAELNIETADFDETSDLVSDAGIIEEQTFEF